MLAIFQVAATPHSTDFDHFHHCKGSIELIGPFLYKGLHIKIGYKF